MDAENIRRLIGVCILVGFFLFAKATTKKSHVPGKMVTLGMVIGFVITLA